MTLGSARARRKGGGRESGHKGESQHGFRPTKVEGPRAMRVAGRLRTTSRTIAGSRLRRFPGSGSCLGWSGSACCSRSSGCSLGVATMTMLPPPLCVLWFRRLSELPQPSPAADPVAIQAAAADVLLPSPPTCDEEPFRRSGPPLRQPLAGQLGTV